MRLGKPHVQASLLRGSTDGAGVSGMAMPAEGVAHPSPVFSLPCLAFASGGTLATWLYGEPTARRLPQRSLTERLKMALDVARGMQVSQSREIACRDAMAKVGGDVQRLWPQW